MTKRLPIEYVQFYTGGSAAQKLEIATPKVVEPVAPAPRPIKRKRVFVDPVAIFGVVVAVCMLFTMLVGLHQLRVVHQNTEDMERYVVHLQQVNAQNKEIYTQSYDLEEIEKTALALGMVPADQVPHVMIDVTEPEPEAEPSAWENIGTFLAGLFA